MPWRCFIEGVDLIIKGLNCTRLTFNGKHYQYEDVPMAVQAEQSPLPPVERVPCPPGGQAEAARRGMHTISLGPTEGIRQASENYRAEWNASKDDPLRPAGGHEQPFIGAWRLVYVNEDETESGGGLPARLTLTGLQNCINCGSRITLRLPTSAPYPNSKPP